ncbi:MAG: helix-turn-helix domain-containing protein [Micrococcales bacterium]|nr:helix-turn-helix domain-containing protein [Micrococcales bacterium]
MPTPRLPSSAATRKRVRQHAGDLSTSAIRRMEAHDWFRELPAEERSWAGLVAQAGIAGFVTWFSTGGDDLADARVFGAAPRELTRSVSLSQTLDLIRAVVDVVEQEATALAEPGDENALHEAVLLYSREIAFAAAHVYAEAAETRGAWDARLEQLVVDAILRGEQDESMRSRAAALGWGAMESVCVVVGDTPADTPAGVIDSVRRAADKERLHVLSAVQGHRLVAVLGQVDDPLAAVGRIQAEFGDGPLVVGPTVPHLFAAGRSARAAISGHRAAPAWPDHPRPVRADDLLGERALTGDQPAQALLLDHVWRPLADSAGGALLETATAYLEGGSSLEGTARALFVHANTVRYRIGRIAEATGYDLGDPHDAQTVRLALAYGRLRPSRERA